MEKRVEYIMAIRLVDYTGDYPETTYEMPEANAARGGGNEIIIASKGWSGAFDIHIHNENFSVYITHTTVHKLLLELCDDRNGEYLILQKLKIIKEYGKLHFQNLWERLIEKETT